VEDAVSIKGLNKAEVLAVLHNASRPLGMGFLQYNPKPITQEEAQKMLDSGRKYFDYVNGRVMKISLGSDDTIDPPLYDRENGDGAVNVVHTGFGDVKDVLAPKVDEVVSVLKRKEN
jgi:hypothetical protein